MGSDPFTASGGGSPGAQGRAGAANPGQAGFRGYEYYQSQVDPEELFRKIFGEAFSRAGFGNHDWMDEPEQNIFGREGISQVKQQYRTTNQLS